MSTQTKIGKLCDTRQRETIARNILSTPGPVKTGHYATVIRPNHRAILVVWMLEVCLSKSTPRRVLHAALDYVDLYLTRKATEVTLATYQLVGLASLALASKYYMPYAILDPETCARLCENAFTEVEVLDMQMAILRALDFQLGEPVLFDRILSHCLLEGIEDPEIQERWLQRADQWLLDPMKSMLGHEMAILDILNKPEARAEGPFHFTDNLSVDQVPEYNHDDVVAFLKKSRPFQL